MAHGIPASVGPHYFAYCRRCQRNTQHGGATDDHGCELGSQCDVCGYIEHPRACAFAGRLPLAETASSANDPVLCAECGAAVVHPVTVAWLGIFCSSHCANLHSERHALATDTRR